MPTSLWTEKTDLPSKLLSMYVQVIGRMRKSWAWSNSKPKARKSYWKLHSRHSCPTPWVQGVLSVLSPQLSFTDPVKDRAWSDLHSQNFWEFSYNVWMLMFCFKIATDRLKLVQALSHARGDSIDRCLKYLWLEKDWDMPKPGAMVCLDENRPAGIWKGWRARMSKKAGETLKSLWEWQSSTLWTKLSLKVMRWAAKRHRSIWRAGRLPRCCLYSLKSAIKPSETKEIWWWLT